MRSRHTGVAYENDVSIGLDSLEIPAGAITDIMLHKGRYVTELVLGIDPSGFLFRHNSRISCGNAAVFQRNSAVKDELVDIGCLGFSSAPRRVFEPEIICRRVAAGTWRRVRRAWAQDLVDRL